MGSKPKLAVTMGDPAGIGAEVVVKAWRNPSLWDLAAPFVIGSADCLASAMTQTGDTHEIKVRESAQDLTGERGALEVIEPLTFDAASLKLGEVDARCGEASVTYFETAVKLCQQGEVDGVVTCPINKEAVQAAGYVDDIGHQEILARLTGSSLTATMLMTDGLRVAHLSTHKSLADAVAYVRTPVLIEKLRLTVASLEQWGVENPCVAVSALNPHGGEGGMLGREEIEEIAPAVEACREEGLNVVGPYPADSVFYRAFRGEFDAVLALYHDQGHIAIKVHNFENSITATMGIPFIRTSVDHGTAFDIAGKNLADAEGLVQAIDSATKMISGTLAR